MYVVVVIVASIATATHSFFPSLPMECEHYQSTINIALTFVLSGYHTPFSCAWILTTVSTWGTQRLHYYRIYTKCLLTNKYMEVAKNNDVVAT
jgi:hypothetical protein